MGEITEPFVDLAANNIVYSRLPYHKENEKRIEKCELRD